MTAAMKLQRRHIKTAYEKQIDVCPNGEIC